MGITPNVAAELPVGHLSAALLPVELLQARGQTDRAVQILESLGAVSGDAIFALWLADLYAELGRTGDVLRVTEGFPDNADDVTAQLPVFRGVARRAMSAR